jgi:hypothetical protein
MKIPSFFIDMAIVRKTLTLFEKLTRGMIAGQQILRILLMKESIIFQTFLGSTLEIL